MDSDVNQFLKTKNHKSLWTTINRTEDLDLENIIDHLLHFRISKIVIQPHENEKISNYNFCRYAYHN